MKQNKINITKTLSILLACTLALSCILISSNTQKAFAYQIIKTFTWKTEINATISTDGSINVAETKIIDITPFINKAKSYSQNNTEANRTPSMSPLIWNYNNFPKETDITLSDAKIAILSNEDSVIGNWSSISLATYLAKWNGDDGPSTSTFTYDIENKHMCLYTELTNSDKLSSKQCFDLMAALTSTTDVNLWNSTKAIINLNYTIERAAVIYKDVADFSWIYVSDTWVNDSYDVNLHVSIPVGSASITNPLGKVTSVEPPGDLTTERNIYAWGHGSSSGIVDLNPNGLVTVNNKIVPGNSDAEIRIVFPSAWLTNLDLGSDISQQNQTKLTTILKEESVWRDFRTDAVNKLILPIVYSSICLAVLIACMILLIVYRKRFFEDAITKTKLNDRHPCLIVRLKNWNHEFAHDIVVSLLVLNQNKKITIKRLASGDFLIKLKKAKLAKDAYTDKNMDIIDKRTINFLFGLIACKNPTIRLSDIQNYARARSYEFMSNYLAWHSLLTDEVNQFAKFNSIYDKIRHILFAIAGIIAVASVILGILFLEIFTPIIGLVTALIVGYIGNNMRNKVYFKDTRGKRIDVIDLNIGLGQYTETVDQFRIAAIKCIKQSVLDAQDIISKWNLENIS